MWEKSSTWPLFRFVIWALYSICTVNRNKVHTVKRCLTCDQLFFLGQHAFHRRWCCLCSHKSCHRLRPRQVIIHELCILVFEDNFEWKISRFLEPSFCLLGGTVTIGLGFAILAAPPLILTPSLAQVGLVDTKYFRCWKPSSDMCRCWTSWTRHVCLLHRLPHLYDWNRRKEPERGSGNCYF